MNNQSLEVVADNWYSRLNNLKNRYHDNDLTEGQKEKCLKLIGIMIGRMTRLIPQYLDAKKRLWANRPNFAQGGVIIKQTNH